MRERYKVTATHRSKNPDTIPTKKFPNKPTPNRTHILKFDNPHFRQGLNVTVRLGDKWHNLLNVGDWVHVEGWKGWGRVEELQLRTFAQCYDFHVLDNEHDPTCHSFLGLREAIGTAYPEFAQAPKTEQDQAEVTVIGFVLYKAWV